MPVQTEMITLRYYFNAELAPSSLKAALAKVKGVEKVELDGAAKLARVTYSGSLKSLGTIEVAAGNAGVPAAVVSHARILVGFKAQKGANLETLQKELSALDGVKQATVQGAAAEIFANLETLTFDAIKDAAAKANFEPKLNTHEWVTLKLSSGDNAKFEKELIASKGVLVIKSSGADAISMWTIKKIGDETFKKLAEKVGAAIGEIVRL